MTEENQDLKILNSYRKLANDPVNHGVITADKTMLQFLAYSLDSADPRVVRVSLDTIQLLADNQKTHSQLKTTFGVVEALKSLEQKDNELELSQIATKILNSLDNVVLRPTEAGRILNDVTTPKKSQVYSFHVFGLNDETRSDLENAVVRVRGVVSLVVDTSHQRCLIRAVDKVTPLALATCIADKAKLNAHLIARNQHNQEILRDLLNRKVVKKGEGDEETEDVSDQNSEDLPPYLPEEDSPVKEFSVNPFTKIKTSAASIIKTATSLFQDSFYW